MKNADLQAWDGDRDCSYVSEPDADGLMRASDLDARGRELPDPVPVAPPVGYSSGPSLADFVQRMIRNEVSQLAADKEAESFEEADDFDVDDDPLDPDTEYEEYFDPRVKMGTYQKGYKAAVEAFMRGELVQREEQALKANKSPAQQGGGGSAAPLADDPKSSA